MDEKYYVIQRQSLAHNGFWFNLHGRYETIEEAYRAYDEWYGKSDYLLANHRVAEAYKVTRYRAVNRDGTPRV